MPAEDCSFKPCLVVPIYNHIKEFRLVAPRLRALGLPVLIIDDGSELSQWHELQNLLSEEPWAILVRSEHNQGKGTAVCNGFVEAAQRGFSHALQIDADGQHELEDVKHFIAQSQQYPESIITAVRIYKNAPKSRMYGRKVTDIWVWIHTLSKHIQDSMCGFRLYPLKPTLQLIECEQVRKGMDFDTDILVRLYWRGVDIRQIETLVTYDANITSHFDVLRDNLRISLMHTRLFFGMLIRFPKLLKIRKNYA